jgi:hypothetical protein
LLCSFTEVRKEACFILGLLAVKPEYQHQIATAQALPGLVKLLQVRRSMLSLLSNSESSRKAAVLWYCTRAVMQY